MDHRDWPSLALADWEPTYLTLHRFAQIVGKVQLALAPRLNHWWHVTERVTARGLTTGTLCGREHLNLTFDFVDHHLVAEAANGQRDSFALEPMTVADFYERMRAMLETMGVAPKIWPVPVEVRDTTPFPIDRAHASHDRAAVARLHRALVSIDRVFSIHRGRFVGKSSPPQFFWGAFDLAVTRFSGRRNPAPPPDRVMRDAYSHEVISHGFWPGGDFLDKGRVNRMNEPVFYAYASPEPAGLRDARIAPEAARYDAAFGEFLLPYEVVRSARDPEATLLDFMESTYQAAARAACWNVDDLQADGADTATGRAAE